MSDQERFDRFLFWLDSDREKAAIKYETIHRKLIKFFTCRGCLEVEDLADITIARIIKKIHKITETYVGDPTLYFYGVARKIHLERCKLDRFTNQVVSLPAPPEEDNSEKEQRHDCLERCLNKLKAEERQMVLDYYKGDKTEKIERRKDMAEERGISPNTLRIRVYRLRATLQECMRRCLEEATG